MPDFREKAMFVWEDWAFLDGSPQKITDALVQAGFEAAFLHVAQMTTWDIPRRINLVHALKAAGIEVYGSSAVYGYTPGTEGLTAANLVKKYGLSGFVFDAEGGPTGWDSKENRVENTRVLCEAYQSNTSRPGAWCYWCFPKVHPFDVMVEAMRHLECAMPMVYWNSEYDDSAAFAMRYLEQSYTQWQPYLKDKVYCPVGRAFNGSGLPGLITPAQVTAFDQRARELGAQGVAWWDMMHALRLPEIWQALSETPKFSEESEESPMPNPIGLFTRKSGWTKVNPLFRFVAGAAQIKDTVDPNPEIKPIELEAVGAKVPFLLWWDLLPWVYTEQQLGQGNWPNEAGDVQFQALLSILKVRSYQAVVISINTYLDRSKKVEDPGTLSFCGQTFVGRVEKWLKANRPLVPLIVATSNQYISAYAPNMNNWVHNYASLACQPCAITESYPVAGAKPNYFSTRTECEWWRYYELPAADQALLLFRGANGYPADVAGMASWLNYNAGADTTPPAPVSGLSGMAVNDTVSLTWTASASPDVAIYVVDRDGVAPKSVTACQYSETGLQPGTYVYGVTAVDSAGNRSQRVTCTVTVAGQPPVTPPADLQALKEKGYAFVDALIGYLAGK